MKNYEQPIVTILKISAEDIVCASVSFQESGSGDSCKIGDLFHL